MSLNWKEINLILSELDLTGGQIQKCTQSAFEVLALHIYNHGKTTVLLIALSSGACRIHETFRAVPRNDKPLRFAEFLKSRVVNGRIFELKQLGEDRIVRMGIRSNGEELRLYIRLWSNAANVIVTDCNGRILDAMRRSPKRGEVSGGFYQPEEEAERGEANPERYSPVKEYEIRSFDALELSGGAQAAKTFNEQIDRYYAEQGGALSLEALREQAKKIYNGRIGRLAASLEILKEKQARYAASDSPRQYGDIIMANLASIKAGDAWLEADNFYTGEKVRIRLDPKKTGPAQAELYYRQYKKAKSGLEEVEAEIKTGREEMLRLENVLERLLAETNPLRLHKLIKNKSLQTNRETSKGPGRPGLSFRRGDWLILVGRDAKENDELLRRHVKGNDLWLHARDYAGAYVFIKQRSGKSYPLELLLDAGNLALFYSKGRNEKSGDLFYTPVKYLRRVKNGPRGLVIPSQEKNLHITLEDSRLKELEKCRIE
ncbi:MAG: NFACT family protein [Spirochaetaceae bacterium]|jgi:predicted ribosome quality control (RQC) complex YloA/Tae2 family protein|nr:NFACT family protein [Spirochaetaceae bacterium]